MPTFSAPDGAELAYHVIGEGEPLICLPGGPMQASVYLGELGGLSKHRQLVLLDLRGTGDSAIFADVTTYRCDEQVDDVEALREHLGLDRVDLLGHSAGANLAALYIGRYPERVGKLLLITPSVFAVGLQVTGDDRLEVTRLRQDEPWFGPAFEALQQIIAGNATGESWAAIAPFSYGRWDVAAQAHQAAEDGQRNNEAAAAYAGEGAFDPDSTRTALATFSRPVLVLAGEVDPGAPPRVIAEYAGLFPNAEFAVQPGAGHMPWLDDPDHFVATVAPFLKD
ncbi:alpha/beta hydrolase [Kribbella sp. NBC_01245]|uniref:alpha/beta fold hydrolase n=1 Tax=Kribbella sp. NBC_01245 TaxID=2903578 RepID=UPI002E27DDB1|nr:alpha/beta hydrolase [Kribbella sp. NBC_01245]